YWPGHGFEVVAVAKRPSPSRAAATGFVPNSTQSRGFVDMQRRPLLPAALIAAGCTLRWLAAAGRLSEAVAQEKQTGQAPAPNRGAVLPVPPAPFEGTIDLRAKDSKSDFPRPIRAPKGAPNILLVLLDDVGYGATS